MKWLGEKAIAAETRLRGITQALKTQRNPALARGVEGQGGVFEFVSHSEHPDNALGRRMFRP